MLILYSVTEKFFSLSPERSNQPCLYPHKPALPLSSKMASNWDCFRWVIHAGHRMLFPSALSPGRQEGFSVSGHEWYSLHHANPHVIIPCLEMFSKNVPDWPDWLQGSQGRALTSTVLMTPTAQALIHSIDRLLVWLTDITTGPSLGAA